MTVILTGMKHLCLEIPIHGFSSPAHVPIPISGQAAWVNSQPFLSLVHHPFHCLGRSQCVRGNVVYSSPIAKTGM